MHFHKSSFCVSTEEISPIPVPVQSQNGDGHNSKHTPDSKCRVVLAIIIHQILNIVNLLNVTCCVAIIAL